MDATTQSRLAAIEARAKALGWDTTFFKEAVTRIVCCTHDKTPELVMILPTEGFDKLWCPAAERLLSCYEPGEVLQVRNRYIQNDHGDHLGIKGNWEDGAYKMVRWDKLIPVEVDDDD